MNGPKIIMMRAPPEHDIIVQAVIKVSEVVMTVINEFELIKAEEIYKNFDGFPAVQGVSFQVAKGECFGLLGPNGAGKTSIVKMVYGFSPVTAGRLLVFGENIMESLRTIKARIGVVPQEDNLDPELSVLENLLVYAGYFRIHKAEAMKRALEILDFMDLKDKRDAVVEHLSGGLKRRLTIGRALINKPELLILDEPTTGLDPVARHLVWQRLRRLKDGGTTILLTTHYLEEADQLCDRLVILYRGKIMEEGSPGELIQRHVGLEALELGTASLPDDFVSSLGEEHIKAWHHVGDDLVLFTNHGQQLAEQVTAKAAFLGINLNYQRLRPTNLEDVFLKLTGGSLNEEGDPSEEDDR